MKLITLQTDLGNKIFQTVIDDGEEATLAEIREAADRKGFHVIVQRLNSPRKVIQYINGWGE